MIIPLELFINLIKHKVIYISLLLLFFYSLTSCNNNLEDELATADAIINDNPDSVLNILSSIEFPEELQDKNKADYWRLRSLAHSKKRETLIYDSLVIYSLNYYKVNNDIEKMLDSYMLASEYFQWKELSANAKDMLSEGLSKAVLAKDTSRISQFMHKLGFLYLLNRNYEEAADIYKKRMLFTNDHFSYYIAGLYLTGDSAKYYRDESIKLALLKGDTLPAAHYLRNYASSVYYKNKDYKQAINAIKKTGELSNYYKNFGINDQILAQIYLALGMPDSAQFYLDKSLIEKRKSSYGGSNDLNLIGTENINAVLQAVIDTHNKKDIDVSSISSFNDSIISSIIKKNAILKEQLLEKNNLEERNLKLTIKKQQTEQFLLFIIFILSITCLLLYLYYLKRRRRYQEVEERIAVLQKLIRDNANSNENNNSNSFNFFKKALLDQLGIIKLIATSNNRKNQDLLSQIIDISHETVSTEALLVWKDLYPIINSVYSNFHYKLLSKYGTLLNEKEIQLCCLLRADYSSSEISAIMQQSLQTIYQRRSTIRKKIGLEDKDDIVEYLLAHFT